MSAPAREYFLSTESALELASIEGAPAQRWAQIAHSGIARPALRLLAGETLELAAGLQIGPDSRLVLRFGAAHAALSHDGATLAVWLVIGDGNARPLAELPVPGGAEGLPPREVEIGLGMLAGQAGSLRLEVGAGTHGDPSGDWIALYEVAVASSDALPAVRARAFHDERAANEMSNFSHVYRQALYAPTTAASPRAPLPCRTLDELLLAGDALPPRAVPGLPAFPAPSELGKAFQFAFTYSHYLLAHALGTRGPDFGTRLGDMATRLGRPPRILSLCCGAARVEAALAVRAAVHSGMQTHWTLMDLSPELLQSAASNFPEWNVPQLVAGNLNEIRYFGRRFDVIVCVSGLHHIVELERVIAFVRDALVEDGEFWSIGEAIGRNGNRLWERDHEAANAFFATLPPRLRHNHATGVVDALLPDIDCAASSFEGIRSEEIEPLLTRSLDVVELYRRDCFLWRLVNQAYSDNYDLGRAEDVEWLQRAVRAEVAHFRAGGRPAELHAIFRRPRP